MTFEVIRPPIKPLLRSSLYIRFSCTCSNFKTYISLSWIHLKIEDTHYFFKFSFMKDEFLVCIDELAKIDNFKNNIDSITIDLLNAVLSFRLFLQQV